MSYATRIAGTGTNSTKGCDVIGFKFVADGAENPDDELFIFESKSGMTKTEAHRLQDAIDDSIKDKLREGMSLNAIKRRFLDRGAMSRSRSGQALPESGG